MAFPHWVIIDLGAKADVNAIRIAWANPFARRYAVQFWRHPGTIYDGTMDGTWETFPNGYIIKGEGGPATLKLLNVPVDESVPTS